MAKKTTNPRGGKASARGSVALNPWIPAIPARGRRKLLKPVLGVPLALIAGAAAAGVLPARALTVPAESAQALLSAKAGATYISPFLGRLDDIGAVGMDLIRDICEIYRNYGFKTQVLAASIRNPLHVVDAAKAGAHVATMPYAVLESLMKHPLTDIGLKKFLDDWNKSGAKI